VFAKIYNAYALNIIHKLKSTQKMPAEAVNAWGCWLKSVSIHLEGGIWFKKTCIV